MTPATPKTTIPELTRPNGAEVTQALNAARRRYPGPVGKVLCREIEVWQEFSHMLGGHSLMHELFEFLLSRGPAQNVVHRAEVE
jgi:hypothetical protein